jgi:hypothetical protein
MVSFLSPGCPSDGGGAFVGGFGPSEISMPARTRTRRAPRHVQKVALRKALLAVVLRAGRIG